VFCFRKDLIWVHESSVSGLGFFSKEFILGDLRYGGKEYEIRWIRPVFFLPCWRGGAQKKGGDN